MAISFTYYKPTSHYFTDDEGHDSVGYEFEYEPDIDEVTHELADILSRKYNLDRTNLKKFIKDFDLTEELFECYEDELWAIFEERALEWENEE